MLSAASFLFSIRTLPSKRGVSNVYTAGCRNMTNVSKNGAILGWLTVFHISMFLLYSSLLCLLAFQRQDS